MAAKKTLYIFPGDPHSEEARKACGKNNKSIDIVDVTTLQHLPVQVDGVPILRVANRFFRGKKAIDAARTFSRFSNRASQLNAVDFADSVSKKQNPNTNPNTNPNPNPNPGPSPGPEKFVNKNGVSAFSSDHSPSQKCETIEQLLAQRSEIYK